MTEKIFNHVKVYCESKGWGTSEEDIIEAICEITPIWKDKGDRHRWWKEHTYVVEINGMFIGYNNAESTGDCSARELGYEFDPSSIVEYEPKEIITTIYVPKELN